MGENATVVFLTYLSALQKGLHALFAPKIFVPIALVLYLTLSIVTLDQTLKNPKGRADLVSGDAKHYLQIGQGFASGDWSMSYVKNRPHRQPLYPAALAPIFKWKGQDFFWLAFVNIVLATLGFLAAYAGLLYFHRSRMIAAIVSILYLTNHFLFYQTTHHFMTEPMHILLMFGIIFAFMAYLRDDKPWQLLAAVAAVGLDYLTRPNGLFIMASLFATIGLRDVVVQITARRWPERRLILHKLLLYTGCVALFMLIAIPSWVPRYEYFGSLFHHGYLSNYMWVDTYKEGHVGQAYATYHWQDYVRTHTLWDAIRRELWGIWNVGFAVPYRTEEHPILYLLALGGFLVAVARGPFAYRLLAIFGVVQLLPLIWTNLSNPTIRVPYASTLPFEIVFAAFFLAGLMEIYQRFSQELIGPSEAPFTRAKA